MTSRHAWLEEVGRIGRPVHRPPDVVLQIDPAVADQRRVARAVSDTLEQIKQLASKSEQLRPQAPVLTSMVMNASQSIDRRRRSAAATILREVLGEDCGPARLVTDDECVRAARAVAQRIGLELSAADGAVRAVVGRHARTDCRRRLVEALRAGSALTRTLAEQKGSTVPERCIYRRLLPDAIASFRSDLPLSDGLVEQLFVEARADWPFIVIDEEASSPTAPKAVRPRAPTGAATGKSPEPPREMRDDAHPPSDERPRRRAASIDRPRPRHRPWWRRLIGT
jgi:hypothetical protein